MENHLLSFPIASSSWSSSTMSKSDSEKDLTMSESDSEEEEDDEMMMLEDSKLRRYENKSFPLFNALDLLYEGKHCFTSSKPQHAGSKRSGGTEKTLLDFTKKRPWDAAINVGAHDGEESIYRTRMDDLSMQDLESESLQSQGQEKQSLQDLEIEQHVHGKGRNKRAFHQRMEDFGGKGAEMEDDHDEPIDLSDEDDHATSRSGTAGSNRGRMKKNSNTKSVPPIEETMSEFLSFRKEQASAKRHSKGNKESKKEITRLQDA
ncbi:uncharacterized protein LOC133918025 [Phragmites australis]|uniref:uncharacterized protein LOC133918025 n=1 Tax=Phragmites australis TaxID=29695 RepID=UPI002D79FA68|nr:uncharacterized protein LOC133918025 [Phragmites australis]